MKKIGLFLTCLFLMCAAMAQQQGNHWRPISGTQYNMTVKGIIVIDGVVQADDMLEIGAFCGNECRGSRKAALFPLTNEYTVMLTVVSNVYSGETITFRIYDHKTQEELELTSESTLTFLNNSNAGTMDDWFPFNFTTPTSSEFHFTTSGNWSVASNWQEGMLPTAGAEVFINAACNLDQDATVNTITINEDCSLTIQSGKKLTASDVVSDDASCLIINDGGQLFTQTEETVFATVKKDIAAYTGTQDNYYFVAPAAYTASNNRIKTSTTNMLSGEYDLYWFDQISPMEEWQNYEASSFSYLYMKKGYLYANSANTTLNFAGKLITTDAEEVGLEYDDEESVFPGFTLIGNPFPCNATVSGEDLVENAYYVMNEAGGRKNVIVAMNPVVAPCTGLFAVAANEDAVVTFTPSTRNATVRDGQNCIRLESFNAQNQLEDRVYVKIGTGNGLLKFTLDGHATQLFAAKDDSNYSVIPSNGVSEMPISFTTEKYGQHRISVSIENLSCDYLHLIDNLTGVDVDLFTTPSYTFEAKPSDYASRFKLIFNVTGIDENDASTGSAGIAYMSNGDLVIDHIEGEATLQVIDMTGRILSSESVTGSYNKALNLKAGVYVVKLNGMTQKIVVK